MLKLLIIAIALLPRLSFAYDPHRALIDYVVKNEIESFDVLLADLIETQPDFDINLQNEHGINSLILAADRGHYEIIDIILSHRDNLAIELELFDKNGYTAFAYAALSGCLKCLKSLYKHGALIEDIGPKKRNSLYLVLNSNNTTAETKIEIVNYLIQKDIDYTSRDNWGWSLVHHLSILGDIDLMQKAISLGLRINTKTQKNGYFPLFLAADYNHESMVQFLIDNGAYTSLKTNKNENALFPAVRNNNPQIIGRLIAAGVSPVLHNNDGVDALLFAAQNYHVVSYNILKEHASSSVHFKKADALIEDYSAIKELKNNLIQTLKQNGENGLNTLEDAFRNDLSMFEIKIVNNHSVNGQCFQLNAYITLDKKIEISEEVRDGLFLTKMKLNNSSSDVSNFITIEFKSKSEQTTFSKNLEKLRQIFQRNNNFVFRFGTRGTSIPTVRGMRCNI